MTIAHISNNELGFDVRAKLNDVIDIANASGGGGMSIGGAITGGTQERVLFTGVASTLADDSYFTWDFTNNVLNLQNGTIQAWGGFYLSFMDNPNVSANYFAGGAGHPGYTTSGAIQNVGLGPYALSCIINGSNNMAIGSAALEFLTSGNDNVAVGTNAIFRYDGNKTIAIGSSAGGGTRTSGDSNIFIGYSAASSISNTSAGNVWIGGYTGTASVFSNTIVFSDGAGTVGLDLNLTNASTWTMAAGVDLAIGGAYYVNAARALYVVPHGSGNNWFAGAAGNPAATGYNNFGAGNAALAALTSGYENVAIGNNAAKVLTSGYDNFALGANALLCALTEPYNTAIGATALQQLGNAGAGGGGSQSNVAIGFAAMNQMESGSGNIGIGYNALSNVVAPTAANWNVVIGHQAGNGLGSGGGGTVQYNTMIGNEAAKNLVGASSRNTWLGAYKGPSATMSNTIAISEGAGNLALLDFHVTGPFTWSISSPPSLGIPPGLQIYNVQDALGTPANYERAVLDWCSAPYTASNIFLIDTQRAGTGVKRNIAIGGLPKAGAPAAADLPSGTFSLIDDTSAGQTWLVFNKAGTIRKVQLT